MFNDMKISINEKMEISMEKAEAENSQCVELEESNADISEVKPMVTDKKKKNKKKKCGQNKLRIKFQVKKQQEPVSLNASQKGEDLKNPTAEKEKEIKELGPKDDAMPHTMSHKEKPAKKPKKGKKRRPMFHRIVSMELTNVLHQETKGRTNHRDDHTLYVRFPPSLSVRDKSYVQPMVPTAVDIRFPRLSPGHFAKFCYIEFETEEECSVMKEKIEKIEVNGEVFYADYVGKKSKAYSEKGARTIDPLRLYVGGLPKGVQTSDIWSIFPTASQILYRKATHKVSQSHAYIIFKSHEEALKMFNATKDLKIKGKNVIVIFATHKGGNVLTEDEIQFPSPLRKKQKI